MGRPADDLVLSNLGFVAKIAGEYRNLGVPFDDLLSEGSIGLIKAATRFDRDRGVKFITYASWWVRKTILDALADQGGTIRIPRYHRKKMARALEAQGSSGAGAMRSPMLGALSLDDIASKTGGRTLIEVLGNSGSVDPERAAMDKERFAILRRRLGLLSRRERLIIDLRYGLSQDRVSTLQEIADRLGISRERVRQIERDAREKLRMSNPAASRCARRKSLLRSSPGDAA